MSMTEVEICERALLRLGITQRITGDVDGTIANCTDTSHEFELVSRVFEFAMDQTMSLYPWPFATKYGTLVPVVEGTNELWGGEWARSFEYPADCLRLQRFANDIGYWGYPANAVASGRVWWWNSTSTLRYAVRSHGGNKVILANVPNDDADVAYSFSNTDTAQWAQEFGSMLAWRIGAEVSTGLTIDTSKGDISMGMYLQELAASRAASRNEEKPYPEADGTFVNTRRGR